MRKQGRWGENAAESIIYHDDGNGSEAGGKKTVYAVDKERNSTVKAEKENPLFVCGAHICQCLWQSNGVTLMNQVRQK